MNLYYLCGKQSTSIGIFLSSAVWREAAVRKPQKNPQKTRRGIIEKPKWTRKKINPFPSNSIQPNRSIALVSWSEQFVFHWTAIKVDDESNLLFFFLVFLAAEIHGTNVHASRTGKSVFICFFRSSSSSSSSSNSGNSSSNSSRKQRSNRNSRLFAAALAVVVSLLFVVCNQLVVKD